MEDLHKLIIKKGDYDLTLKNIKRTLEYTLDNLSLATPSTNNQALLSLCYNELGSIYVNQKDYNPALQAFSKVASINYNKWETCAALSDAHYKVNKLNLALENLTKCVEHQSKTAYTLIGHPSVMATYRAIEDIDMKNKTYAKASIFTLKLLDAQLERKQLGHTSSLTSSYQKLDDVVLDDSILEEALELCFKLLDDALETKLLQDILIASIYKTNVL
ncbi:unnamed protein product [Rotaria socialis]|uniref:Uncharacterized protein n=1 Tax=Rotaria socialis TaxID=392032 RepID=A0A820TJM4_9BILA|nr:unnamed protein product [Rotaria socialis]CAF4470604.1 unnamed protein product [Rotaria socialis]